MFNRVLPVLIRELSLWATVERPTVCVKQYRMQQFLKPIQTNIAEDVK